MNFCISLISNKYLTLTLFLFHFSWCFSQHYDSSAVYKISSINISGNKKTREAIITRELSRKVNDTLTLRGIGYFKKRSEQNIFNTQLFVYDTINPVIDHANKTIAVNIVVKERWYIWPVPLFEIQDRNFNTWWLTKDLFRINYGFALGMDNFSGVSDKLVFIFQRGYSEKYGVSYRRPYINKNQTLGFNMQYLFGQNNEVTYITQNNTTLFVRKYDQYLRAEHEAKLGMTFRPNLYEFNTLEAVFKSASVKDTVVKLNPEFYGRGSKKIKYLSLQYRYTFDNRDNKAYPLRGWAFDLWLAQDGFDFSEGSPVNNLTVAMSLRKHSQIYQRIYLANLVKQRWMNVERLSFNFNRALGYNDVVRGYEYYVMDGQKYFLTKNSLRYQLIKPRVYQNKRLIMIKQFNTIPYYAFINVFFDAAFVEDKFHYQTNTLNNSWQYGYGLGIDFITYYDIVLRLEYSFNRQKQSGFFIHMSAGF